MPLKSRKSPKNYESLESIYSDPRFQVLLTKMKFPQ